MSRFAVAGSPGGNEANEPLAVLWNPHATMALRLLFTELWVTTDTINSFNLSQFLRRSTTRGNPESTITPDADNSYDRLAAPASGAVLDLANFSGTQPVIDTSELWRWGNLRTEATGLTIRFNRLFIPAGTGIVWYSTTGYAGGLFNVSFEWEE